MNTERRAQIETLFEAALDEPPGSRAAFLAEVCRDDPALRSEVEALLAGHELSDGAVDRNVAGLAASLLPDPDRDRRIGSYRVLSELGRGGMGVVYLAERDDGQFRRRVAVKILRGTPDADELHRRFRAERQILASLQHPNIAQLLDGGVTDGRIPYLVMEYADGLPITAYCDRERLDVGARLRLFQEVCAAVHHAHKNLVLHRDLKPSNIFVTQGRQVKLLDFGIAKLLNPNLGTIDAPVTRTEFRVMTPEYASPEQVRGETLSTASDVYALGVVLYELLAGHPPYRLARRSPQEVAELVCEREPERPSTKLLRTEQVTGEEGGATALTPASIGAARGSSAERLRRVLRGDLDAIVMRALRKEPGRRYGSAELLSEDIQRYLDGLPVLARKGSRGYHLRKFIRRHRVEVAAAGLVGLSLIAGLGAAFSQASLAGRERDRAEAALLQAEEVTDFLMELFQAGDSDSPTPGGEITARDLLRRGAARADELADQPVVQARMLDVIGQMHHRLGHYDEAQRLLERAVAIRRAVLGPASLDLAASLIHLSWVHRSRDHVDEARRLVAEALEIRRQVLAPDHPGLAEAVHELGWLAAGEEQERLYREALGILQRTDAWPERRVGLLQGISTNLRRQGRLAEGVQTDRQALQLAEREFGPDHFQTGYAMIHLADHVRDIEQDHAAAERLYRRGLELLTRHFGENHLRLIHGLHSLGTLQSRRGDHAEAELLFRRALAIRMATAGPDHPHVAMQLSGLAGELERQNRLDEAEAMAREGLDKLQRALGQRHPAIGGAMHRLADILFRQGRHEEADGIYREAIELKVAGEGVESVSLAEIRRGYGRMLLRQGHHERAEEQLLQSLAVLDKAYRGSDHPNLLESKRALMELYEASGKAELVERYRVPPGTFIPH